jgi:predicted nucleic acid-binding protein
MLVLDTNVLIDYLRGAPAAVRAVEQRGAADDLAASEVTRIELLAGMRAGEEEAIADLERGLVWVPVDEVVATRAGQLAQAWRRSHKGIELADYAIAATARVLGAELWTTNVRHFPMFPDLEPPY